MQLMRRKRGKTAYFDVILILMKGVIFGSRYRSLIDMSLRFASSEKVGSLVQENEMEGSEGSEDGTGGGTGLRDMAKKVPDFSVREQTNTGAVFLGEKMTVGD